MYADEVSEALFGNSTRVLLQLNLFVNRITDLNREKPAIDQLQSSHQHNRLTALFLSAINLIL